MGFLETLERLGKKVGNVVGNVARMGSKGLGKVASLGGKVADIGGKVLGVISQIPGVPGTRFIEMASKGLAKIGKGAEKAQQLQGKIERGRELGRAGQEALRTRDIAGAKEVLRGSRALVGEGREEMRRATQILRQNR